MNSGPNTSKNTHPSPKDLAPADISLQNLGKAMSQLDLSSIPAHKRQAAVFNHFAYIMQDTLQDRSLAQEIRVSHKIINNQTNVTYKP